MGGVKAERVQARSLTVRLQRTKAYVKFISVGDRLANQSVRDDASRYVMVVRQPGVCSYYLAEKREEEI